MKKNKDLQIATFAAGCFWGVETYFMKLSGVIETAVGYMGGHLETPTYEDVCTGKSGHAEVLQLQFDPDIITYEQLLDHFWQMHNPTQLNRQGPDFGTQYRSAVFYHSEEQRLQAEQSKRELEAKGIYKEPVVTLIEEAGVFWRAEEYHQKYHAKRGSAGCRI